MLQKKYLRSRLTLLLGFLVGCFLNTSLPTAKAQETEHNPKKQNTILFVDNHDILYYAGLKRTLRPLTRHKNNPVISSGEKP